jgi:hypothetical protein
MFEQVRAVAKAVADNTKAVAHCKTLVDAYNKIAAQIDSEQGRLATLLAEALDLAEAKDDRERTWEIAGRLGDRIGVIDFLAFLRVNHLEEDLVRGLRSDEFFSATNKFYTAPTVLLEHGRAIVNAIWQSPSRLSRPSLEDAAIALYFTSLIAPMQPATWFSLYILHSYSIGPGPYRYTHVRDTRDHLADGTKAMEKFLEYANLVDPETQALQEVNIAEFRKLADGNFRAMAALALQEGTIRFLE